MNKIKQFFRRGKYTPFMYGIAGMLLLMAVLSAVLPMASGSLLPAVDVRTISIGQSSRAERPRLGGHGHSGADD
jgi:hypothetical protein